MLSASACFGWLQQFAASRPAAKLLDQCNPHRRKKGARSSGLTASPGSFVCNAHEWSHRHRSFGEKPVYLVHLCCVGPLRTQRRKILPCEWPHRHLTWQLGCWRPGLLLLGQGHQAQGREVGAYRERLTCSHTSDCIVNLNDALIWQSLSLSEVLSGLT